MRRASDLGFPLCISCLQISYVRINLLQKSEFTAKGRVPPRSSRFASGAPREDDFLMALGSASFETWLIQNTASVAASCTDANIANPASEYPTIGTPENPRTRHSPRPSRF